MSTVDATDALFSRRELIRWYDRVHPFPVVHEPEDDFVCAVELRAAEQALLVAGTVCLQAGQPDLWKAIYAVHAIGHRDDDALAWLEEHTAAARRGAL